MATTKPMVSVPVFDNGKKYELIMIVANTAQLKEKDGSPFTIGVDALQAENKPAEKMLGSDGE